MFILAESIWSALDPTAFPLIPYRTEFNRGVDQYALGKGIERCWMNDRQPIGFWFDGSKKKAVEDAIWISPGLASRWLGFAAAKEKWTNEEQQIRWQAIRAALEKRIVVLVRLAAFPKVDLFSPDDMERPSIRDLDEVRFLMTLNGSRLPTARHSQIYDKVWVPKPRFDSPWNVERSDMRVSCIAELQGRELSDVDGVFWPSSNPLVDAFGPLFPTSAPKGLDGSFGNYHVRYFLIEAPAPERSADLKSFEIRILSPSKERLAIFKFRNDK